eukprot:m.244021 g.244021  ORF g.244021 m.244021 type:complete len:145 (+) comp19465_c0_seq17:200-634(+)
MYAALAFHQDGNYKLWCNGHDFEYYCAGMQTGSPNAYVSLSPTALNTTSRYTGADKQTVETHFTKLRVDPCTLHVDMLDRTFSTSVGRRVAGNNIIDWEPLGIAGSCVAPATPGCDTGVTGIIDLSGTSFAIKNTSQFTVQGIK